MKGIKLSVLTTTVVMAMLATQPVFSGPNTTQRLNSSNNQNITIERAQRGIAAKLVDKDDYYFQPNGRKIKLYRKKDVYLVNKRAGVRARSASDTMQRFKGQYGDRVKAVNKHQFGSATVVRLDNRAFAKKKSRKAFDIKPEMLASMDSSISGLLPIFTTANGQDDLMLLPT